MSSILISAFLDQMYELTESLTDKGGGGTLVVWMDILNSQTSVLTNIEHVWLT